MSRNAPCGELAEYASSLLDELCVRFPLGYRPALIWKRLRVSAGMAYYTKNAIGLSVTVLVEKAQVRETLIHEYAHLLAVHRSGLRAGGHGIVWREAMKDLGAEPRVTHKYDVQRNTPRQKVLYICQRCGSEIVRTRRLPRRRIYVHAHCGGAIRLKSVG